jgi:DNA-dependent protein kinase catalytic subunit
MQQTTCVLYAKSRVNSAKSKLYGTNPSIIMREDLASSSGIHKDRPYLKYYINAVIGEDHSTNFVSQRAKILKEKGEKYRLTVEEQVGCIIEQSTDLNILGRTWFGWHPFI